MITIYYQYWSKKEGQMKPAEQTFYDINKAVKFCWSMKNRKMILLRWETFDSEENEEMYRRVNISAINGF